MLRRFPDDIFVFGDNVERRGLGGQAAEMRGEPNAIGIVTKWYPSNNPDAFFSDRDYNRVSDIVVHDIFRVYKEVSDGRLVVWPQDGVGTGLAQLPKRAPKLFELIETCRRVLDMTYK
mgnify:CR=1 FL=1